MANGQLRGVYNFENQATYKVRKPRQRNKIKFRTLNINYKY